MPVVEEVTSKSPEVKVQKDSHNNVLKVQKIKILIMQNSTFQNNKSLDANY